MKIFAVLGSPNRNGNSAALLTEYLKGVKENHENVQITKAFLHDMIINYCVGCNKCKTEYNKKCIINDDMRPLYKKIEDADVIVIASPIYWYNITAQLKTFIDRLYALDYESFPAGKKLVFLASYGAYNEEASGVENPTKILASIAEFLKMESLQKYAVSVSTKEFKDTPVSQNVKVLNEAYRLGADL